MGQQTVKYNGDLPDDGKASNASPGKYAGTPKASSGAALARESPTINILLGLQAASAKEWAKDVKDVLHEARQCGVPSSLIEHTRLAVKKRMRDQEEQARARAALERALSKKDVATEEVQRRLLKLKRLHQAGKD